MSLSISFAPIDTSLTSNSRFSSLASAQGSELWRVNGLNFSPSTGSPAIRPIFGRCGFATRAMARTRSYSSRRSRCGVIAASDCLRSSWLTTAPR